MERPISATAMPTKPEPAGEIEHNACCSPMMLVDADQPASAPEIIMAMMVMRADRMPA